MAHIYILPQYLLIDTEEEHDKFNFQEHEV